MIRSLQKRKSSHKANLAAYTFTVLAVSFLLLFAGGFTTTIGAGMVFPDWPLSNGSLNPPGWTTDEAMRAEHSHRLLGMTVGSLCIGMVVWMYLREERNWLRILSYAALGMVVFQGLLGGLRVLLVDVDLALVHGVTAQVFLCMLVAIAVGSARWWQSLPTSLPDPNSRTRWKSARMAGIFLCGTIILQLVIGATMRHKGAGLAIPYFPFSTEKGDLLPPAWNWAVTIHFTHRVMAVLVSILLVNWVIRVFRIPNRPRAMGRLAISSLALLAAQVILGAGIIWTLRKPVETTLHVLNGALLLSICWAGAFASFRPVLEGKTIRSKSAQSSGDGELSSFSMMPESHSKVS